jgi:hypothetical protein
MTNEEYTKFITEILQEDIKEGKLILEGFELTEGKREIMIDFAFDINSFSKKLRVTFDYNEFSNIINSKNATLQN